ncbi:MAG: exodeoxyribonuclease V subunit gamma [Fibrobacteria bacterium]|nr:exodeoxyribonuclease V subunit gamma [Fibrobacteria bacterium]
MPVKIFFHYDLSILANILSDSIGEEIKSKGRSPFTPVRVAIPINHFKSWLPMQLSSGSKERVTANIRYAYLEKAFWELLTELAPDKPEDLTMLDKDSAALQVLAVLNKMPAEKPGVLEPLRNHLYFKTEQGEWIHLPDYQKRIWQLSQKLSGLFLDYEYHREDVIAKWLEHKCEDKESEMETCQAELYRQAFTGKNEETYITLPRFSQMIFKQAGVNTPAKTHPARYHFFGFSELSRFHQKLLWQLGQYYDIRVYQFNVCREFWEDVSTPAEDKHPFLANVKKQLHTSENDEGEILELVNKNEIPVEDNPLLKAWGKPGRELLRGFSDTEELFKDLTPAELEHPDFDEWKGERDTVLLRLQGQVLDRLTPEDDMEERGILSQDKSLQVYACPDIYREVETACSSIIDNLAHGADLKTTDITVLVSDMAAYKPVIQSVFSRYEGCFNYNLQDSTAEKDSVYGQGVMALLELCGSSFTRSGLFSVFYNPCFMQAAGVSRTVVDNWSEWVRALNIYRWADSTHKKEETAEGFDEDLYTWEWGLKRLRLGRVMSGSLAQSPDSGNNIHHLPPAYTNQAAEDRTKLSRFSGVAELLIKKLRAFNRMPGSSPEALIAALLDILEHFLAIPADRTEEAAVRNKLNEYLVNFSETAEKSGAPCSPELLREAVKSGLAGIPGRKGTYGLGGVTVASIQNGRPIPFRLIYIMGLDEKRFPSEPARSTLDLRTKKRRIGDIDPKDHGLFRFLEAIMAAREKLYLSFIGRDLQKDEKFQPSSAIKQLLYSLDNVLDEKPVPALPGNLDYGTVYKVLEMPLHGFSHRYRHKLPDCFDLYVNYDKLDRELLGYLVAYNNIKSASNISVTNIKEQSLPPLAQPETIHINLWLLERFLLNPVDAQVRYHLGIKEEQTDDPTEINDEPFFSTYPVDYNLINDTLSNCLVTSLEGKPVSLQNEFERSYVYRHTLGETPDSLFELIDKKQLMTTIESTWKQFTCTKDNIAKQGSFYPCLSIGNSPSDNGVVIPTVVLNINGQPVEISGKLSNLWLPDDFSTIESIKWKRGRNFKQTENLSALLFALLLQYVKQSDTISEQLYVIGSQGTNSWKFSMNLDECKKFLESLVGSFIKKSTFDWLPWEIIDPLFKKTGIPECKEKFDRELTSAIENKIEDSFSRFPGFNILNLLNIHIPADGNTRAAQLIDLFNQIKPVKMKKKK